MFLFPSLCYSSSASTTNAKALRFFFINFCFERLVLLLLLLFVCLFVVLVRACFVKVFLFLRLTPFPLRRLLLVACCCFVVALSIDELISQRFKCI